jgi:hypothetical protein
MPHLIVGGAVRSVRLDRQDLVVTELSTCARADCSGGGPGEGVQGTGRLRSVTSSGRVVLDRQWVVTEDDGWALAEATVASATRSSDLDS